MGSNCSSCYDNMTLPGAPEYGLSRRATSNRGCNCGRMADSQATTISTLARTVTRARIRWERPTESPLVFLEVN